MPDRVTHWAPVGAKNDLIARWWYILHIFEFVGVLKVFDTQERLNHRPVSKVPCLLTWTASASSRLHRSLILLILILFGLRFWPSARLLRSGLTIRSRRCDLYGLWAVLLNLFVLWMNCCVSWWKNCSKSKKSFNIQVKMNDIGMSLGGVLLKSLFQFLYKRN